MRDTVERVLHCIIQNEGGCRLSLCPPAPRLSLALAFASTDLLFLLPSANAEAPEEEMLGDRAGGRGQCSFAR